MKDKKSFEIWDYTAFIEYQSFVVDLRVSSYMLNM